MHAKYLEPIQWHQRISSRVHSGTRFGTLYATDDGEVRCVLLPKDGSTHVVTTTAAGDLDTVVDAVPAAAWSEREAHDLYGVVFTGHEPMRPLLKHDAEWRVPVIGEGVHEVAVGPIHAGVIESGHFRFHTVGERVLLLDLKMFYKHRGLERAAEGQSLADGIAYAHRACAGCCVSNSLAYAQAAEQLLALRSIPELARIRTVLLELERVWNHLNDLSAICAGVGFAVGTMGFARLKEEAQRLNSRLFGHRFLFNTIAVGESRVEVNEDERQFAITTLRSLHTQASAVWHAMHFNGSVEARIDGVGVLSHHDAIRLGAVGPVARAAGVAIDARMHASDFLTYPHFSPAQPQRPNGDVAARAAMRIIEVRATINLLIDLLGDPIVPVRSVHDESLRDEATDEPIVGVGRIESPRGETICCLEAVDGRIARFHLRTSSYANWPLVCDAVPGNIIGDFPLINKSFELCYACVDR